MHDENDLARTRANMAADVELLPCPFCGSTDALRLQNTHTASFWVSCSEDDGGCGAKATGQFFPGPTRRTRFVYDPEAPEGSTFEARTLGELPPEYRRAAKSAIAAWNRRANVAHVTAAKAAEIEALRKEVAAWRELSDHVRVGACSAIWPDRYTDERTRDVAAALKRAARMEEAVETLRAEVEKVKCELMDATTRADRLAEALRRYRNEVPIGHQPHMLAHEVDDLLREQEEGQ